MGWYTALELDRVWRQQGFFKFPEGWHLIDGYDGDQLLILVSGGRVRDASLRKAPPTEPVEARRSTRR